MNTSKLQIPLNPTVLLKSRAKAKDLGFSSINEVVRVFLCNFINGKIDIKFDGNTEYLSEGESNRIDKLIDEYETEKKNGQTKSFSNVKDFLQDLKS